MKLFDRDKQIMVDVLGDLYSRSKIVILKILGGFLGSSLFERVSLSKLFIFSTITIYHGFNPISVRKLSGNRPICLFPVLVQSQ